MGEVTINSNAGAGLYNVKIDTGTVQRDQRVAKIDVRITEINLDIAEVDIELDAAQSALNTALSDMDWAIDEFSSAPADDNAEEREAVARATEAALIARADIEIIEIRANELELEKTSLELEKTELTNLVLERDSDVWCCDLTLGASGDVASIEIPGENKRVLIAPGGRTPNSGDGHLESRGVQFGHQCYYNAAILPGWQKFKPTHRLGVITGFNPDQTCSVTLDTALSSTLDLDINTTTALVNVPIEYMTCHRAAFLLGDRVVVKFEGQSWDNPKVVGFESNPRGCSSFIIGSPGYTASPRTDYVAVYPSGDGVSPILLKYGDQPEKISNSLFGIKNKFSHDTKPYVVSSTNNFVFSQGGSVLVSSNIRAVFAVAGGRYITVLSDGRTYSTSAGAFDGHILIGDLPFADKMYIRPDGEKIYGLDSRGYCSAVIDNDGMTATVTKAVLHPIADPDDITEETTGTKPEDDLSGTSGAWTKTITRNNSYSGFIGVFWTGSPGAWTEQIVTASSERSSTSIEEGTWSRPGGTGNPTSTWRTIENTSNFHLDIDAGATYTKRITEYDSEGTDIRISTPTFSSEDDTFTSTTNSVLPRILGTGNYIEEVGSYSSVIETTHFTDFASPAVDTYSNEISYGGNKAIHNGNIVELGETFEKTVTTKPLKVSAPYYLFEHESDYNTVGFGVMEIVLANSGNERIAETATSFMIASFNTTDEATIDNEVFGYDSVSPPYISTYGYLDDEESVFATLY